MRQGDSTSQLIEISNWFLKEVRMKPKASSALVLPHTSIYIYKCMTLYGN